MVNLLKICSIVGCVMVGVQVSRHTKGILVGVIVLSEGCAIWVILYCSMEFTKYCNVTMY